MRHARAAPVEELLNEKLKLEALLQNAELATPNERLKQGLNDLKENLRERLQRLMAEMEELLPGVTTSQPTPPLAWPQGAPASSAMCEKVREMVLPGGATMVLWQSRLSA